MVKVVEDDRLAQSRQSEVVRREREATHAVQTLEGELRAERADHCRQARKIVSSMNLCADLRVSAERICLPAIPYGKWLDDNS